MSPVDAVQSQAFAVPARLADIESLTIVGDAELGSSNPNSAFSPGAT
jgi:hypothetical protein